jgi:hypothetical protein
MKMTKWIAALAAASLATAPVIAQAAPASRSAAPVSEAESLGGPAIAWIFAAVMVVGAILILIDDDDDVPAST